MRYRLNDLTALAAELGLPTERVSPDRLDVIVADGCTLAFCNLPDEDETLVGFDGTPWHSHGIVHFMTGDDTYVECDELDILIGLASGDLVVVSSVVDGKVTDRWIAHKLEDLDIRYLGAGEELHVFRLPNRKARPE